MNCLICAPGPETLEAAKALASAVRSAVSGLPVTAIDISAHVATGAVELSDFDEAAVAVLCVLPEFSDDVWRWYGLNRFADSLSTVLRYVCFYGRYGSEVRIPSPRVPFFDNSDDGLRSLVAFIGTAVRAEPRRNPAGDRVGAGQVLATGTNPHAGTASDAGVVQQELMSVLTSPSGDALSGFVVRMLNLLSNHWGPFEGSSTLSASSPVEIDISQPPPKLKQIARPRTGVGRPVRVFFSYSHSDERMRDELSHHLASLRRSQLIESWHDRCIRPGADFGAEIDHHLNAADLILFLVSARFLASDYCYTNEMLRALERHREGTAHVVPIILRPVDWHDTPLGELLALPKDGRAVITWPHRDAAWAEIAREIRGLVEELGSRAMNT